MATSMPVSRIVRTTFVVLFALALLAGAAAAETKRKKKKRSKSSKIADAVAVISIDAERAGGPPFAKIIRDALVATLEAEGVNTVPAKTTSRPLRRHPELRQCNGPKCLEKLNKYLGAKQYLRIEVREADSTYTFQLELLFADGSAAKRKEGSCAVCGEEEASKSIARSAMYLITGKPEPKTDPPPVKLEDQPVLVEIATRPPGAQLRLDGEPIGIAPYRGKVKPGTHEIVAILENHIDGRSSIEVKPAQEGQKYEVVLVETPGQHDGKPSRPFRLVKWLALATAVGTLGTGGTWLYYDGRGTCAEGTCPNLYDTATYGYISTGAGVILGATAIWMFLRDGKDARRNVEVSAAPTRGGMMGALRLDF